MKNSGNYKLLLQSIDNSPLVKEEMAQKADQSNQEIAWLPQFVDFKKFVLEKTSRNAGDEIRLEDFSQLLKISEIDIPQKYKNQIGYQKDLLALLNQLSLLESQNQIRTTVINACPINEKQIEAIKKMVYNAGFILGGDLFDQSTKIALQEHSIKLLEDYFLSKKEQNFLKSMKIQQPPQNKENWYKKSLQYIHSQTESKFTITDSVFDEINKIKLNLENDLKRYKLHEIGVLIADTRKFELLCNHFSAIDFPYFSNKFISSYDDYFIILFAIKYAGEENLTKLLSLYNSYYTASSKDFINIDPKLLESNDILSFLNYLQNNNLPDIGKDALENFSDFVTDL